MSAYTHHGDCSTFNPCERCFEFGQTTERRSIIKLLGEHSAFYDGMGDVICSQCNDSRDYDTHLAALIKGENK